MAQEQNTKSESDSNKNSSTSKPQKRLIEQALSKEQLVEKGTLAAALLRSQVFNEGYLNLLTKYQDEMIQTQPHESNRREYLYYKTQILSEVATELAAFVADAERAVAEEEAGKLIEEDADND